MLSVSVLLSFNGLVKFMALNAYLLISVTYRIYSDIKRDICKLNIFKTGVFFM